MKKATKKAAIQKPTKLDQIAAVLSIAASIITIAAVLYAIIA